MRDIPQGHWRTKDGRLILISQMADSHLVNTIWMLERQARKVVREEFFAKLERIARLGSGLQGEMAQDAFDDEIQRMNPSPWFEAIKDYPPYKELTAEADKRSHDAGLIAEESYREFTVKSRLENRKADIRDALADSLPYKPRVLDGDNWGSHGEWDADEGGVREPLDFESAGEEIEREIIRSLLRPRTLRQGPRGRHNPKPRKAVSRSSGRGSKKTRRAKSGTRDLRQGRKVHPGKRRGKRASKKRTSKLADILMF